MTCPANKGTRLDVFIGTGCFADKHQSCFSIAFGVNDRCAFAVQGTAPATDAHRCIVREALWRELQGGLAFEIEANRFLHHMVRFLVGTMPDIARGKRAPDSMRSLLAASDNRDVSPPAPAHALILDRVDYPRELYLSPA